MEKDKLKNLIDSSREEFEMEAPSERVWTGVQRELHGTSEQPTKVWMIAAAIAAIIGLGVALTLMLTKSEQAMPLIANAPIEDKVSSPWASEMEEVDNFYATQVDQQINRLSDYEIDDDLMEEVAYLTEEFELLKEEMGAGMDDEKVVSAMIENYRLRLDLLEDLLEVVGDAEQVSSKKLKKGYES